MPDLPQKYRLKVARIEDAVQLKKPDRLPIIVEFGYFVAKYSGISYQDLIYDRAKCVAAYRKVVTELDPDAFHCIPFDSGPAMEAIDSLVVKWPGHGLPANQSHQYVEGEYMLADEYDSFLEDPSSFLFRKYLPRISGSLKPFGEFPDLMSIMGVARGKLSPSILTPEFVAACGSVFQAAKAGAEWDSVWSSFVSEIESTGYPAITLVGLGQAPFDFFSDHLRGMKGIMLDMYRQPNKLLAAMDRVLPIIVRKIKAAAVKSGNRLVFMGPHRGAEGFMSLKQFEKFYWPGLKTTILTLIDCGFIPYVFWEGNYTSRLPYLMELPPGKIICRLDRTNIYEAHKLMGGHHCLTGGILPSLLQTGSVQQMENECRKLIEEVGRDGGYIMGHSCPFDEARIENVETMFRITRKYGKYA